MIQPVHSPALLVETEGLVHIYKNDDLEVVALQGLDLQIEAGELVAIVGRSGSGKTTLMNVLAGLEVPSAGRAMVDGHDLTRMTEGERARYCRDVVGYVWQHSQLALWPALTALENVQVPMVASGAGPDPNARAQELLRALGFGHRLGHLPEQLSGGERQRLAMAVALANRPRLLLADEPTSELDGPAADALLADVVALLRDLGVGAVMVSHDPRIGRHVDRVIRMRDGRTSTETRFQERGQELVADELVIVDRTGRLQLPPHLVEELRLHGLVRVRRDGDGVRVAPVREPR